VLDVVLDDRDRIVEVAAGRPDAVLATLSSVVGRLALEPVEPGYDLAIAGVPHPKDTNFYQASRVPTYLQLGARPIVREGGSIIVAARCPEGMGEGVGERRFARALASMDDPAGYVRSLRDRAFAGGEQRAYVMAKVLAGCRVILVGAERPDLLSLGPVATACTIAEAIDRSGLSPFAPARVVVVEDPFRRLPVARG
jgi:nickel-dependent lactate racemase